MKRNRATRPIFLCLMIMVLAGHVGYAKEIELPYMKCEISLSKSTITPGEPVNIIFKFTNTSDGEVSVSLYDLFNGYMGTLEESYESEILKVVVLDENGKEVPRRKLLCRPQSQSLLVHGFLKPGETVVAEYPLHLRITTNLDTGHYMVNINKFAIYHGYLSAEYLKSIGSGVKSFPTERKSFSGPSLTLDIEPYYEPKLTEVYEVLMKKVRNIFAQPSLKWCGLDYFDIEPPVRTLLWAEGPIAVSYQIELLYDSEKGFRFWPPAIVNTWDNIVRYATVEQIERVVKIARHPECMKNPKRKHDYSNYYDPGLAWAIHYWYENGPEDIRELTRELVTTLPQEYPCPDCMKRGVLPYGK